jgi:uncharacterized protein YhdP
MNLSPAQTQLASAANGAFHSAKQEALKTGALTTLASIELVHVHAQIAIEQGKVSLPATQLGKEAAVSLPSLIATILTAVSAIFSSNPALAGVFAAVQSILSQLFPTQES